MFKQIDYTMIVVSDMQRSVEFYRDKLGIPVKFQSPEWTEFATGTTTLALHGGGVANQQPPAGDPSKIAGACSIGFNVDDVDKTYEELKTNLPSHWSAAANSNETLYLNRSGLFMFGSDDVADSLRRG